MENLYRIAFWSIFAGMIFVQLYFSTWLRLVGQGQSANHDETEREGRRFIRIRILRSIYLVLFLLFYALNPPWLEFFFVPIPDWLRVIGIILGGLSLAFYAWARKTIGLEWSSKLQLHPGHNLITRGPYARIRHPIYSSMIGFLTSLTLVSANMLFIVFFLISIVDLALRIPKEENMMLENFGDKYKAYMVKTGKLLPKIK